MADDLDVVLDGSAGEGGGQILRTALSLSAITGKPFSVRSIRAGRLKPGDLVVFTAFGSGFAWGSCVLRW